MAVITLTSDWGTKDPYLASVKGALLSQLPDVTIVDVSHQIAPFDLNQASFVLRNSYKNFPAGTVHIIGISTEASIDTPHTLAVYDGHYFIGADTGIFSLIFDHEPEKIIELDIIQDSDYFTFSERDVFVKVAVHIVQGNPVEQLGVKRPLLTRLISFQPVADGKIIKGKIIYVDVYENLITNISSHLFRTVGKGSRFTITFRNPQYKIRSISTSYSDVPEGEMLAIFGTTGLLEIAMNRGNAGSLLGMNVDDPVRVEFGE
ncbi:MAG TPA: SAM-dependent chlorinase/fluorinase [Bacteroidales bacterium]|nr:SAM-dependent chlorinase/fluorinase [Bacteroidales bacterium]HNS47600.1 SAM-dependent chlorinase/fluorinase [Bacteroidales bacterium]